MSGRAYLEGPLAAGGFKWCVFPCQKRLDRCQRIDRECRVPTDPRFNGPVWRVSGPADAPTLTPSIDCDGCFHGFITNGEVL